MFQLNTPECSKVHDYWALAGQSSGISARAYMGKATLHAFLCISDSIAEASKEIICGFFEKREWEQIQLDIMEGLSETIASVVLAIYALSVATFTLLPYGTTFIPVEGEDDLEDPPEEVKLEPEYKIYLTPDQFLELNKHIQPGKKCEKPEQNVALNDLELTADQWCLALKAANALSLSEEVKAYCFTRIAKLIDTCYYQQMFSDKPTPLPKLRDLSDEDYKKLYFDVSEILVCYWLEVLRPHVIKENDRALFYAQHTGLALFNFPLAENKFLHQALDHGQRFHFKIPTVKGFTDFHWALFAVKGKYIRTYTLGFPGEKGNWVLNEADMQFLQSGCAHLEKLTIVDGCQLSKEAYKPLHRLKKLAKLDVNVPESAENYVEMISPLTTLEEITVTLNEAVPLAPFIPKLINGKLCRKLTVHLPYNETLTAESLKGIPSNIDLTFIFHKSEGNMKPFSHFVKSCKDLPCRIHPRLLPKI